MIERGQVFVRALNSEGKWVTADALDLDEESFRRLVLTGLWKLGTLVAIKEVVKEPTPYKERPSK
jgi:hypothetical protein